MTDVLGFICLLLIFTVLYFLIILCGDIYMIKTTTQISWKESIRCGWLYFLDRFNKKL